MVDSLCLDDSQYSPGRQNTSLCNYYIPACGTSVMMKHAAGKGTELRRSDSAHHTNTDKYDLASMLSRVDQTNCHPEHESGSAQGKEEWQICRLRAGKGRHCLD